MLSNNKRNRIGQKLAKNVLKMMDCGWGRFRADEDSVGTGTEGQQGYAAIHDDAQGDGKIGG